jgi:hypothetical protein
VGDGGFIAGALSVALVVETVHLRSTDRNGPN